MTLATLPDRKLTETLQAHPLRAMLIEHPLLKAMQAGEMTNAWVELLLSQWWYPLNNFPVFLGQCVAQLPDASSRSAVARILYQETGQGRPDKAHEVIYQTTMERAGFAVDRIVGAAPLPETRALIADYEMAASDRYFALGCLAATEFADLAMVSAIGAAVSWVSGVTDLEWVQIHVEQEPDHVEEADHALLDSFAADEGAQVVAAAGRSWRAWIALFDALAEASGAPIEARPIAAVTV